MKGTTKTTLRLISIVVVLVVVLMELDIIPVVLNYRFWFLVGGYGLLLLTLRK